MYTYLFYLEFDFYPNAIPKFSKHLAWLLLIRVQQIVWYFLSF